MYDTLKFIHIAAAIAWLGGGLLFTLMNARVAVSRDLAALKVLARQGEWFGQRFFAPMAITTLLAGIAAVVTGPWEFSELWISLGFVGILASIVLGAVFITRASKALRLEAEEATSFTPGIAALQKRLNLLGIIDALVVFSVVAVMVFKPGA